MTTETKTLKLDQIRIDGGTQPRVAIDEQVVADYADLYAGGENLPPVTVFFDGTAYWLADGFHRYWANKRIDCEYVFAEVHEGTQRDAVLFSVGANSSHGLRRTNPDKRKAVLTLLEDDKWSTWPQTQIAKACGVTPEYVSRLKNREGSTIDRSIVQTADGRTMNTSNIGRRRDSSPSTPPRQIMTREEYEAEAGADTPAPKFQAPSKAIAKGQEAINLLKSILPSDPRCVEAMHMVRDWIIHNFG